MYASFGLGVKTGIDLPVESLGYSGKSTLPGHLLDFSIGQYDTYTPIQLSQYINTIASGGIRLKPYLLKEVYSPSTTGEKLGEKIYTAETTVLGHVDVEDKYINRVKEGFKECRNAKIMQKYKNDAEIKRLVNIIHKIEKVLQVLEPRGCGSFFF